MSISWQELRERLEVELNVLGSKFRVKPDPNERKIVEEVVTYIENKGIFHAPFEWEHPKETYAAAVEARNAVNDQMLKLRRKMVAFGRLEIIRDALRDFQRELRALGLQEKQSKTGMTNEQITSYDSKLVTLRHTTGAQVGRLAAIYELNVSDELAPWLPPPPNR
jgi:hypothetical protein